MTRQVFRKKRCCTAPPSYLPRIQHNSRSSSRRSCLRRLASSTQCEQSGRTSVGSALGSSTSVPWGASAARAKAETSAATRRRRGMVRLSFVEQAARLFLRGKNRPAACSTRERPSLVADPERLLQRLHRV